MSDTRRGRRLAGARDRSPQHQHRGRARSDGLSRQAGVEIIEPHDAFPLSAVPAVTPAPVRGLRGRRRQCGSKVGVNRLTGTPEHRNTGDSFHEMNFELMSQQKAGSQHRHRTTSASDTTVVNDVLMVVCDSGGSPARAIVGTSGCRDHGASPRPPWRRARPHRAGWGRGQGPRAGRPLLQAWPLPRGAADQQLIDALDRDEARSRPLRGLCTPGPAGKDAQQCGRRLNQARGCHRGGRCPGRRQWRAWTQHTGKGAEPEGRSQAQRLSAKHEGPSGSF